MKQIAYKWKQAASYTKGRGGASIKTLVLHSTDGHKQGDIAILTGTHPKVSVHWYVPKDLEYWHFVQNVDTAYHAGVVDTSAHNNAHSLGIEQEHMDGAEDWPDDQVQATANLAAALQHRYGVLSIVSHASIARPVGRKVDPQDYPWGTFWDMLTEAMKETWEFVQIP